MWFACNLVMLSALVLLQWTPCVIASRETKPASLASHVLDGGAAWISNSVNWTISFPKLASLFVGGRVVIATPAAPNSLIFNSSNPSPSCNISAQIRRGHMETGEWSTNGLFRASCHMQYLAADVLPSGALGASPAHASFGAAYPGFEDALLTADSHPPALFWGSDVDGQWSSRVGKTAAVQALLANGHELPEAVSASVLPTHLVSAVLFLCNSSATGVCVRGPSTDPEKWVLFEALKRAQYGGGTLEEMLRMSTAAFDAAAAECVPRVDPGWHAPTYIWWLPESIRMDRPGKPSVSMLRRPLSTDWLQGGAGTCGIDILPASDQSWFPQATLLLTSVCFSKQYNVSSVAISGRLALQEIDSLASPVDGSTKQHSFLTSDRVLEALRPFAGKLSGTQALKQRLQALLGVHKPAASSKHQDSPRPASFLQQSSPQGQMGPLGAENGPGPIGIPGRMTGPDHSSTGGSGSGNGAGSGGANSQASGSGTSSANGNGGSGDASSNSGGDDKDGNAGGGGKNGGGFSLPGGGAGGLSGLGGGKGGSGSGTGSGSGSSSGGSDGGSGGSSSSAASSASSSSMDPRMQEMAKKGKQPMVPMKQPADPMSAVQSLVDMILSVIKGILKSIFQPLLNPILDFIGEIAGDVIRGMLMGGKGSPLSKMMDMAKQQAMQMAQQAIQMALQAAQNAATQAQASAMAQMQAFSAKMQLGMANQVAGAQAAALGAAGNAQGQAMNAAASAQNKAVDAQSKAMNAAGSAQAKALNAAADAQGKAMGAVTDAQGKAMGAVADAQGKAGNALSAAQGRIVGAGNHDARESEGVGGGPAQGTDEDGDHDNGGNSPGGTDHPRVGGKKRTTSSSPSGSSSSDHDDDGTHGADDPAAVGDAKIAKKLAKLQAAGANALAGVTTSTSTGGSGSEPTGPSTSGTVAAGSNQAAAVPSPPPVIQSVNDARAEALGAALNDKLAVAGRPSGPSLDATTKEALMWSLAGGGAATPESVAAAEHPERGPYVDPLDNVARQYAEALKLNAKKHHEAADIKLGPQFANVLGSLHEPRSPLPTNLPATHWQRVEAAPASLLEVTSGSRGKDDPLVQSNTEGKNVGKPGAGGVASAISDLVIKDLSARLPEDMVTMFVPAMTALGSDAIASGVAANLTKWLVPRLEDILRKGIGTDLVSVLKKTVTTRLANRFPRDLVEHMMFEGPLIGNTGRSIVASTVAALSQTLNTDSASLYTRLYCKLYNMYCAPANATANHLADEMYQADYYAEYYSSHYTKAVLSHLAAETAVAQRKRAAPGVVQRKWVMPNP